MEKANDVHITEIRPFMCPREVSSKARTYVSSVPMCWTTGFRGPWYPWASSEKLLHSQNVFALRFSYFRRTVQLLLQKSNRNISQHYILTFGYYCIILQTTYVQIKVPSVWTKASRSKTSIKYEETDDHSQLFAEKWSSRAKYRHICLNIGTLFCWTSERLGI